MSVHVLQGDITSLKVVDAIVSAANGVGIAGAGVAGAIARAAGKEYSEQIRKDAFANPERPNGYFPGEVFVTGSGKLMNNGITAVMHAVTMRYPGEGSSYHTVDQCLDAIFTRAIHEGFKAIAVPGLGTGIGNLSPNLVAMATVKTAKKYGNDLEVYVVDIDPVFVESAKEAV